MDNAGAVGCERAPVKRVRAPIRMKLLHVVEYLVPPEPFWYNDGVRASIHEWRPSKCMRVLVVARAPEGTVSCVLPCASRQTTANTVDGGSFP